MTKNKYDHLDDEMKEYISKCRNVSIAWILLSSYAYYILDKPILTDIVYDKLMSDVKDNFPNLQHRHKYLISEENLEAGSLYNLKEEDYPEIVKSTCKLLINKII